jgi:Asp-tRNA(Asn)/Glu-tRNA(Gln) amidotransferase A subunit family amidase
MTVKESYDVAGMPTTWGAPELKDNRPSRNALAVDRLLGAGVVLFGKSNVPLMLADWQSYNAVYGSTNNPWDLGRTPGGSSGGSAAALAAGLTGIEAGSDIGASIRNPAHYCGVFGHKPTYGIVPPRGPGAAGRVAQPDIAVIGPLARSADDLALGLSAMAGADEIDGAGWQLRLPAPRRKAAPRVQGRRHAHRPQLRGRPGGAGPAPGPRRLPREEEGAGERSRAPRHRHGRGGPRLRPAPALGHLGPPDGRRAREEPRDRAAPRARR